MMLSWLRLVISRFSLGLRFMVLSLIILVVGAYVIGNYVSGEIRDRVLNRTSALTALYVDSVVTPHLQELSQGDDISVEHRAALDQLLVSSDLGGKIVSFKVWHSDGAVVYAKDHALIGQHFPIEEDLAQALAGSIATEVSSLGDPENALERLAWDQLIETYAPIREEGAGRILGAVEFYQDPADLNGEIQGSQRKGWLIVGGSTGIMYLLLVGMVSGASRTISRQHERLERLARQNAALAQRVKSAAARKSETDELLMKRVAQDLHDGPAQDISLALLRVESLSPPASARESDIRDIGLMRIALDSALTEIRQISTGLRLPELAQLTLADVVRKAARDHEDKTRNRVGVEIGTDMPPVNLPTKIALYRVTQEALNNASRHAGVSEEEVRMSIQAGELRLEVHDHGSGIVGADPAQSGHLSLGIRGMRERIEMLGGRLEILEGKDGGTVVLATLPLTEEEK
jgi:signal transduction histidine kinase